MISYLKKKVAYKQNDAIHPKFVSISRLRQLLKEKCISGQFK